MPPTTKDLDTSNASANAGKAQPVALEVPVTVNGARTVEGSDKREPFSETTQTVLVFGNGAVIRLASSVTPGQLLFLTNDKTKKEVVCQVLKSKNFSNVSGYVELEFTEAVSGFWGVRFPESAPKPASAPAPVAVKPAAPPAPVVAPAAPSKIQAPTATMSLPKPPAPAPAAPVVPPVATMPKAPAAPIPVNSASTSAPVAELKPAAPVAPKAPIIPQTPANTQASEALKRESARLQEQLSSMLFHAQPTSTPSAPPAPPKQSSEAPAKVIDITRPQAPVKGAGQSSSTPSGANLEADEVRIPSWLEPLARNAATPAQNEISAPEEEETDVEYEVQDVSAPTTSQEVAASPAPASTEPEADVPFSEAFAQERKAAKGNKMILIGSIAAGFLVLAAGGTWYARQSPSKAPDTAVASTALAEAPTTTSNVAQPPGTNSSEASSSSTGNFNSAPVNASPTAALASSQPTTPTVQPLRGATDKSTAAELSAYKKLAEPQPQPVQPAPKKPSIGNVKLAGPSAAIRRTGGNAPGEADLAPSFGGGGVAPAGDALGGGLAAGASKPTAPPTPLPVGGDVKQAKLISSTPPLYPTLAKTQHVEGAVRVDALVDESGRVSTAKVVSGPTLLQQAAIDAIRQWKYQPATLDGKPVPVHLTVTLQFKLQ